MPWTTCDKDGCIAIHAGTTEERDSIDYYGEGFPVKSTDLLGLCLMRAASLAYISLVSPSA